MATLLHLDSSILGPASVSRQLSAAVVEQLTVVAPTLAVIYRDLVAHPLPHLNGHHLAAGHPSDGVPPEILVERDAGGTALDEFLRADEVVIGVGFYNFGIPSQLKAWIDRILIAGRTFRYAADGRPEELMGGKRVVLAIARGGYYGIATPAASFEHAETYLRAAFGFIGIASLDVVAAEGMAVGPQQRADGIKRAMESIAALGVTPA